MGVSGAVQGFLSCGPLGRGNAQGEPWGLPARGIVHSLFEERDIFPHFLLIPALLLMAGGWN